jgi:hypothetical protein
MTLSDIEDHANKMEETLRRNLQAFYLLPSLTSRHDQDEEDIEMANIVEEITSRHDEDDQDEASSDEASSINENGEQRMQAAPRGQPSQDSFRREFGSVR